RSLFGDYFAQQISDIPLSNDTVSRHISDMASDVKEPFLANIMQSQYYALQLDETTDVAGLAQLLTYVRYVKNGMSWDKCVGICTDGTRSMTGRISDLVTRVQNLAPLAKWTHCMIHRESLASKQMPLSLEAVLKQAVQIINFIKARPLNAHLFSLLCQEMGAEHEQLLFHTEVRWLSRGRVLHRLYELRSEVKTFLSDLARYLDDPLWLVQLSYLVDIFDRLNSLNTLMQGRDANILLLSDKVSAFVGKLDLWRDRLINKNVDMFPNFADCVSFAWVRDPFSCPGKDLPVDMGEQLVELKSDTRLRHLYSSSSLPSFWLSVMTEYPQLSDAAIKLLLPFTSTYLCEAGFSKLTALKTKYRNRLQVEDDLRLALSNTEPRIALLCKKKQAQVSH
uniref:HAT C-terminal dimerisation domain-containing protein n=1 Tax=Sinocyclocheilus anshuiensis TaxID=1608454 RepID=A0A671MBF3_9TELE